LGENLLGIGDRHFSRDAVCDMAFHGTGWPIAGLFKDSAYNKDERKTTMKKPMAIIACITLAAFTAFAETRTVYMVELDIRNSSFSLSIGKHIRNAMNAFQMEIPVDKDFYDKVHEGEELESHFKAASFFMKGSISSMKVTVVRKWTKQVPVEREWNPGL